MKKIFVILLISASVTGCATIGYYQSKITELTASSASRFEDIPVPAGFKFLPLTSFIAETGDARVGILEYTGKAFPYSITKFYKNTMPIHGWEMLNVIESRESIISFEKGTEICIIKFSLIGKRGTLTISISPLSKKSSSPSKTKPKSNYNNSSETYE